MVLSGAICSRRCVVNEFNGVMTPPSTIWYRAAYLVWVRLEGNSEVTMDGFGAAVNYLVEAIVLIGVVFVLADPCEGTCFREAL